jgi:EAL domain-containing protein (putative c-di-GMP-specific phosphodiesterase class I)
MYKAKAEGQNLYRFYEDAMNAGVESFLKIDNALRHALEHRGLNLSLAFQPQFSSDGQQILGAEALIRWTHPELGPIGPNRFIPIAEATGQIIALGRWIIEEAVRSYSRLPENRTNGQGPISLSINCSAHQLREGSLVRTLQETCMASGVSPKNLLLEVTESAIMSDEIRVMETLTSLRSLGYRISIDDFGTGYSCLSYLQKIRPSEIKIDQSFINNMLTDADSRNIIAFTLNMATSMGMEVVAEGVETEEQRAALAAMGPIRMQGFLLGRPQPLEHLVSALLG